MNLGFLDLDIPKTARALTHDETGPFHDQHPHHVPLPTLSNNDFTHGSTIADAISHSKHIVVILLVIYARSFRLRQLSTGNLLSPG